MILPELAAPTLRPQAEQIADYTAYLPERHTAPQSWYASVTDARMHWYDLIAGFPERLDIHDPIGRYQRRMQFELEAMASRHHLFFALTRPQVRFDPAGAIQWGFFSLKLTLPLLVGQAKKRDSISFELTVPFAATLKKPTVKLTADFVTLNWGGLVEAYSIHDILQAHAPDKVPCEVVYVGQTHDAEAKLSRAQLPALQKLHAKHKEDFDTLLLVQQLSVKVNCASGDPAELPHNAHPRAAAVLQGERMDLLEAALIRHFEGTAPEARKQDERQARRTRVTAVQEANNLVQFTLDLEWPEMAAYDTIGSALAAAAPRHLLSCFVADGDLVVSRMTPPAPARSAK